MREKLTAAIPVQANDHTSRARAAAQRDYLRYVGEGRNTDLSGWIRSMKSRGLAANTIRQRISLVQNWLGTPGRVMLPPRNNVRTDTWLTRDQLRALLAAIPKSKNGHLDFALIATIMVTGFKLQKARALRWKDFHEELAKSAISANRIHEVVLNAIDMIEPAKRDSHSATVSISNTTKENEYIFTAFCPRSPMVMSRQYSISGKKQPLSTQEINRRIKRYARQAGLEPEWISSETLRRTRTELSERVITCLVQEAFASRNSGPVRWKSVDRDKRLHGIGRRRR